MPFITEEIYQTYFKEIEGEKSIHLSKWPESEDKNEKTESLDLLLETITKIRQEKSNNQKPMNSEITLTLPKETKTTIKEMLEDLKDVSVATEINEGKFKVEF